MIVDSGWYKILSEGKFSLSTEAGLQAQIEVSFVNAGILHLREHRLSDKDRVDFFIDGSAIEVKIKGTPKNIYKQLLRYAQHDCVTSIVLVTNKAMGMVSTLNGKPVYVVNLGKSWL